MQYARFCIVSRVLSVFQKYLHLEVNVGGGVRVRIIERPGLWLKPDELERVVADLRGIAATSVPAGELHYGIFESGGERLRHSVVTIVYDEHDTPIALNALALLDVTIRGQRETLVHLGLVLVDPDSRSRGLSWVLYGLTCILLLLRNQLRPIWISNVTQVPAIIGMVCETFSNAYPRPGTAAGRTFTHLQIARQIMAHHRNAFGVGPEAHFDEATQVIQNAYTGGSDALKKTFAQVARHRDERFNQMCATGLDYERGDDFLQIAQMNLPTILNYVIKDVPRGSVVRVLGLFAGTLVTALVMPVLHWFSSDRAWGVLRPRGGVRS
jgi:hypothetical protein